MNISLDQKDTLNATLTIIISKDDYEPKYTTALHDFRKKGTFKGFRKGKAPLGYIRKIYGESALAEAVNDILQKEVMGYLTENKVNFLGQPLPSEDQKSIVFDVKDLGDYEFKFDLGLAPEFEVSGLDAKIRRYDVEVPAAQVDEEWLKYRNQLGTRVEAEDDILANDVLNLKATELDGGKPKKDGVESSFSIQIDDFADDSLRDQVLKLKKGEKFTYAPDNLERGKDLEFVKKYHLGLEDDLDREFTNEFEAKIEKVNRVVPAEVNQEFIDKLFGPDKFTTEEEGRGEIEKAVKADLDHKADAVLYKNMQISLMDANAMDVPEEFLARWIDSQREENQPVPSDQDRKDFILDLKWQLIKDKIALANELEVKKEEIEEGAFRKVYQYIGPYGDQESIQRLVGTILQNREQVERISREVMATKVFEALKTTFNIEDEAINEADFKLRSDAILQPMHG